MTYGHLRADCLYTGISSGPNARFRVWESLYPYLLCLDQPRLVFGGNLFIIVQHMAGIDAVVSTICKYWCSTNYAWKCLSPNWGVFSPPVFAQSLFYQIPRNSMFCSGLDILLKVPFALGHLVLGHLCLYLIHPWAYPSPQPKRHLDRLSRFCTAHYCDGPTDRQTDRPRHSICNIYYNATSIRT